jgi:hypothetical protein
MVARPARPMRGGAECAAAAGGGGAGAEEAMGGGGIGLVGGERGRYGLLAAARWVARRLGNGGGDGWEP